MVVLEFVMDVYRELGWGVDAACITLRISLR